MNEEIEIEVRKLVPEDGDVIVVTLPGRVPQEGMKALASNLERLTERIGKKLHCLVLADGAGIHLLRTSKLEDANATVD